MPSGIALASPPSTFLYGQFVTRDHLDTQRPMPHLLLSVNAQGPFLLR